MQQDFYKKNIIGGANRFTKEVILNPSAAEANRPLWFSSPGGSLLTQFAGYPTVFNNTVLKRFVRESINYPALVGASKVLPTVILMTGVAHVGNLIRSNGKSTQDYRTGTDLPAGIVMRDAVRRWGGMGPLDYAHRFTSEFSDRKSGNISAGFKMISGPLGQDVIDSIAYRKGLIELGATNLPYYGAYDIVFGEGTRQSLRKRARQLDKGILIPEEEENKNINIFGSGPITGRRKNEPRLFYDRGGIVKNVPNVKDEPDERVDKRTGRMYNSTSESAQDLSDRELKGQMEGLGLRKPFVFGGLSMLSRKNLMRELTKTLNRRKKYEKDNMGNEREIDVDLHPDDAKLIEEEVPFTTYLGGFSSAVAKQLAKKGLQVSNKIANENEVMDIYQRIYDFTQNEYEKWFNKLPKPKQEKILKLEENYEVKFDYMGTGKVQNELKSSEVIGSGLTRGAEAAEVFPHVLEFYKDNPEIITLDQINLNVAAPLHQQYHLRMFE
jgi:hypothetical protein